MEDLYGLEGPITPKYLEKMEHAINNVYHPDFENNTSHHLRDVLENQMHVERAIVDSHMKIIWTCHNRYVRAPLELI